MLTALPLPVPTAALLIGLGITLILARASGEEMVVATRVRTALLEGPERERFVAAHNAARKEVGLEAVTWSEQVAASALEGLVEQQEALIEQAKEGWKEGRVALPEHRKELKYGENIAGWMGSGNLQGAERAVGMWLREKPAFDRLNAVQPYRVGDEKAPDAKPPDVKPPDAKEQPDTKEKEKKEPIVVGHYTQIVWRETKQIGAAKLSFELVDEQGNSRSYVAIICNYDPPGNRTGEQPF